MTFFSHFFANLRRTLRQPKPSAFARPSVQNSSLSVTDSSSVSELLTVRRENYKGTITPSATGLPANVTASFSPATI